MSKIIFINKLYYEWWKTLDKTIFFLIIMLFALGLFFSLVSTSLIASDKFNTNSYYFFLRHLLYTCLGIFFIIFFSFLNQKNLFKISTILFITCFVFLVLVPFIGIEVKGSKRWLDFFFLPRFQPIEVLKPFIIIMIALILSSEKSQNIYYKYFLSFILIAPIIFLLITQPDIGQTFLVLLTWLSLIFISGINLIIFFLFFGLMLFLLLYLIFFVPKFSYILIRLKSFFDPSSGNNYQSEKASEAIINGGFFGKGIGEGVLKSRVPEAHTDYIISVISEEFGVIVIILLMIVFLFLIYQVFRRLYFEKNNKVKLILVGSASIILFQALIHLGVNIRLFPTTGMTLPFLSYGGSSIIGTAILSGIILNLTKRRIIIK
tara:strand:- start:4522 stop:5649 length:1128 start_codon:yes stop_codon:yes gene_type:complete